MKIIVAGDYCDRYRVTDCIKKKEYASMLEDIKQVTSQADYSIINFEFPIVQSTGNPIAKCGPNLKGQVESVDAIHYAGFNVCTLANNHILDQGAKCCIETKNLLEEAGMQTVGVGVDKIDAARILYVSKGDIKVAIINCAEHEFSYATTRTPGSNPIDPISQYHQIKEAKQLADYVVVISHGGHEHFNLPSPRMKDLFHFYIEVGADAVVNHHQHCFSGYEVYQDRPIFYGLGNFLFDNPNFRNSFWNYGYMVELGFQDERVNFKIIPYTQCNEKAKVTLLKDESLIAFENEISKLNGIIGDDEKLRQTVEKYYEVCIANEIGVLEPYRGRLLNKLLDIGLLPRFMRGSKIAAILNHVNCESHRDKLVYALTHKNK